MNGTNMAGEREATVIGDALTHVSHALDLLDELDGTDFASGYLNMLLGEATDRLNVVEDALRTLQKPTHDTAPDTGKEDR